MQLGIGIDALRQQVGMVSYDQYRGKGMLRA